LKGEKFEINKKQDKLNFSCKKLTIYRDKIDNKIVYFWNLLLFTC